MQTISLMTAIPLRDAIRKRILELTEELERVSTVTFAKGETPEPHDRSVEDVLADLEKAQEDYRTLDLLVTKANVTNTIQWNGREMTILEAIEINKQNREKINLYTRMAKRPKTERAQPRGVLGNAADLIAKTTYDPAEFREKASKLTRQANLLSALIDEKNVEVRIPFDASRYLGA